MSTRRQLKYADRKRIEEMLEKGINVQEIADTIGFNKTTVYNEIRRSPGKYSAEKAQMSL